MADLMSTSNFESSGDATFHPCVNIERKVLQGIMNLLWPEIAW